LFTERICYLTNRELTQNVRYPRHLLEDMTGKLDYADCKSKWRMPLMSDDIVMAGPSATWGLTSGSRTHFTLGLHSKLGMPLMSNDDMMAVPSAIEDSLLDPRPLSSWKDTLQTTGPSIIAPPQLVMSAKAIPRSHHAKIRTNLTAYVDIFIDNFCGEGQNLQMNPLKNQHWTLFHNIDKVLRPNNSSDNPSWKKPISASKLEKGDAALHDLKHFLGWDFQGSKKELLMALHHWEAAIEHLDQILVKTMSGHKEWERILGELRSLVPDIPGSHGQFSILQAAITQGCTQIKVQGATQMQLKTF
jgi:hypothetical protein